MDKDHSDSERGRRKEMFYLMMHSTHYIYGYVATDIWIRTSQIAREEGRKEMFYLMTHSTHFINGYVGTDTWLRTTQIAREEITT